MGDHVQDVDAAAHGSLDGLHCARLGYADELDRQASHAIAQRLPLFLCHDLGEALLLQSLGVGNGHGDLEWICADGLAVVPLTLD